MSIAILCPGQGKSIQLSQVEIVKAGITSFQYLVDKDIRPKMCAGLSLGEYTALYCAGVLTYETVLWLVYKRQAFMEEVCRKNPGKMAVIIGLDYMQVKTICEVVDGVWPANYLCKDQIVVSGLIEAVNNVAEIARSKNARIIELQTKGAFHTPLMNSANKQFSQIIERAVFAKPKLNFYSSVTGKIVNDPLQIKDLLSKQMVYPVIWERLVQNMALDGGDEFIELEPSGVLMKLLPKII